MTRTRLSTRWLMGLGAGMVLIGSLVLRAQGPQGPERPLRPAPVQPLPYSHKQHLALPGLECRTCHVNPDAGKLMTYPATSTCMRCHDGIAADRPALETLARFATSGEPIPWTRVYRVPDDVYWQHGTHLRPDITCANCHGPVADREVIALETNIVSMKGCMACHEQRQVYTDCGDCHEPRQ